MEPCVPTYNSSAVPTDSKTKVLLRREHLEHQVKLGGTAAHAGRTPDLTTPQPEELKISTAQFSDDAQ